MVAFVVACIFVFALTCPLFVPLGLDPGTPGGEDESSTHSAMRRWGPKSAKVTQDTQTAQVTRKSAHFPIKWAVLIYWAVLLLGSSSFSHGGFTF